jgi:hypothetical protein
VVGIVALVVVSVALTVTVVGSAGDIATGAGIAALGGELAADGAADAAVDGAADAAVDATTEGADDAADEGDGAAQDAQTQKAIRSYQKQIDEHTAKLENYKENPWENDSDGRLARNADNPERVDSIIKGRIAHLTKEIEVFTRNMKKLM